MSKKVLQTPLKLGCYYLLISFIGLYCVRTYMVHMEKCLEMTFLVFWCYINKLNWTEVRSTLVTVQS